MLGLRASRKGSYTLSLIIQRFLEESSFFFGVGSGFEWVSWFWQQILGHFIYVGKMKFERNVEKLEFLYFFLHIFDELRNGKVLKSNNRF